MGFPSEEYWAENLDEPNVVRKRSVSIAVWKVIQICRPIATGPSRLSDGPQAFKRKQGYFLDGSLWLPPF